MEHWSHIDEETGAIKLRHFTYPAEGSQEWVVLGDSVEFRITGKEGQNLSLLLSDIEKVKLKISKWQKRLDITFCLGGSKEVKSMLLLEQEGAVEIAQKICEHIAGKNPAISPVISDGTSEKSHLTKGKLYFHSGLRLCLIIFLIVNGISIFYSSILFNHPLFSFDNILLMLIGCLFVIGVLMASSRGMRVLKRQEFFLKFSFNDEMKKQGIKAISGSWQQYQNEHWFIGTTFGRVMAFHRDYIKEISDEKLFWNLSNPYYKGTKIVTVTGIDERKIKVMAPSLRIEDFKKWFYDDQMD